MALRVILLCFVVLFAAPGGGARAQTVDLGFCQRDQRLAVRTWRPRIR